MEDIFTTKDIRQIESKGLTVEKVLSHIEIFKKGFPFVRLDRRCTAGDGITVIPESDFERLARIHAEMVSAQRVMKFVPASGAASRMFKPLLALNSRYKQLDEQQLVAATKQGEPDHTFVLTFVQGIKKFAFYDDLKSAMVKAAMNIETLLAKGQYKHILEYTLTPQGLNYANLPKGLIKFHSYPGYSRTAFEEHLVEAATYSNYRVHFTVALSHQNLIEDHIRQVCRRYEKEGIAFTIDFSTQKPSTDTIAVDPGNKPFRNQDGSLLFRPGGHGALLENIHDLAGDIIFIKNIDNIVPDHLKSETYCYKRVLGGYLIELQHETFRYLRKLANHEGDDQFLDQVVDFAQQKLSIIVPKDIDEYSRKEKIAFLFSRLHRPLRVCGMVKNEGEPGGGPFWVKQSDGSVSLQIVEKSQIDMTSSEQQAILESSTHFNPVDLVCGVRDYTGKPFNLMEFVDPDTGFISHKSQDGKELKALELPGLWNGAMAHWNTVFVEVPLITFNPVKTVNDLLRQEHQQRQ